MSLDVLVNGELVTTVDGVVLNVSVRTPEGEKAAIKIPADGYRQLELITTEISPGGPVHLSQVEEMQRRLNRARGVGQPETVRRSSSVNLERQNPEVFTLEMPDEEPVAETVEAETDEASTEATEETAETPSSGSDFSSHAQ